MAELLLELFSEEIPARMQARAAEDLKRLVTEGLERAGLAMSERRTASRRRGGSRSSSRTCRTNRLPSPRSARGRASARPSRRWPGFSRRRGWPRSRTPRSSRTRRRATTTSRGSRSRAARRRRSWPRSCAACWRSFRGPSRCAGARARSSGCGRCIRSCACSTARWCRSRSRASTAGNATRGHRFHGNEPFEVTGFADYADKLAGHKVMLDAAERADEIRSRRAALAKKAKLELVEDEALLAENAGLTEWPMVLMGAFDESFLDGAGRVPDDVDEEASEVLLAARSRDEEARQQVPAWCRT